MALGVLSEQFAGGIKMRVFADAGENVEDLATVSTRVLNAVRRDDWQTMLLRKIAELLVQVIFAAHEVALDFDVNVFAAEGIDQKLGVVGRILGSTDCHPVGSGSLPDTHFSGALRPWK